MNPHQPLLDKATALIGANKKRALIVGGDSETVLTSVSDAQNWLHPILIGNKADIESRMADLGLQLPSAEILSANDEQAIADCAVSHAGDADIIVKGQIHTDIFMRSLLGSKAGLRGDKLCSHVFYMASADFPHPYFLSDGALNLAPEGKVGEAILTNMAELAEKIEGKPAKIALLSATESVNPKIGSTVTAEYLQNWAGDKNIFGPVALDIAINPEAAKIKGYNHPCAGYANGLLVPSLEAGNMLFKSWVHYNNALAAGIVIGAKLPIVLTSRSDSAESRMASLALAIVGG